MEERLHKFAVLVDSGSFTHAALQLHTSQPALSIAISKLEKELHIKLIIRDIRPFKLTKAGEIVYESAKKLYLTTDNLKNELAELSHRQLSISIGMIDSIASMLLSSKNNIFDPEKEARVSFIINNSRYLLEAIEHDELDIAIVTEQYNPVGKHLQIRYVAIEPLVLVVHSAQVDSVQKAWDQGRIDNFISYDQPSNSYQFIRRFFEQNNIAVTSAYFSSSVDVMLRLVQLQKGIAALPYLSVKKFVSHNKLALIGKPKPIIINRRIFSLMRQEKQDNHLITSVTNRIEQQLNFYYQEINSIKTINNLKDFN
jgi:DNA-binding transcriptional LysR family regulator